MRPAVFIVVLRLVLSAQVPPGAATPREAMRITLREALSATLRQHPALQLQEQEVESSRAALLRAHGQFDARLQAGASQARTYRPLTAIERAVFDATSATAQVTTVQSSATQQFRNGISAGPVADWSRLADNNGASVGFNQSRIQFQVNVPLLRGRGREVTTANEQAAQLEMEVQQQVLRQTLATLLADTATAYWNAEASRRNLEVYRAAEERGETYRDTVRVLIDGDKLPAIEYTQVEANLSVRRSARISAEQQLVQANQQLALAMGLDAAQLPAAGGTADRFPEHTGSLAAAGALVAQALAERGDLLATRQLVTKLGVLSTAAQNLLKPQVDVRLATGYSGLREGQRIDRFPLALVSGIRGVDLTATLQYDFAPRNRAALGAATQATIAVRQAELRTKDLERQIASSVVVGASAVDNAATQVQAARQALAFAEQALANEREKLRLGSSSLVDVLIAHY